MTDREELIKLIDSEMRTEKIADAILAAGFHKRPIGIPLSALLEKHHGGIEITRHEASKRTNGKEAQGSTGIMEDTQD